MDRPFDPPGAPAVPPPGTLDVGRAVTDALSAITRGLLPLVLAGFVLAAIEVASILTCVGWIVGVPAMLWGTYRFTLDLIDGRPRVEVFWSELPPLPTLLGRMWGLVGLLFVVQLPVIAVSVGATALQGTLGAVGTTAVVFVASSLYGLLSIRVLLAAYRVVERPDLPLLDAFRDLWESTRPVWGGLVVVQLLVALVTAPAQVLAAGVQMLSERSAADPSRALEALPQMLALYLGLLVVGIGAAAFGSALLGATYRQLYPAESTSAPA